MWVAGVVIQGLCSDHMRRCWSVGRPPVERRCLGVGCLGVGWAGLGYWVAGSCVYRYLRGMGITLGDVLSLICTLLHVSIFSALIITITRLLSSRPNPLCSYNYDNWGPIPGQRDTFASGSSAQSFLDREKKRRERCSAVFARLTRRGERPAMILLRFS